jgi:hypothetical protein
MSIAPAFDARRAALHELRAPLPAGLASVTPLTDADVPVTMAT